MKNPKIKEPVAILGFGTEGQAALRELIEHGLTNITVYDEKESLEGLPQGVKSVLGKNAFMSLDGMATVIRSPGVYYKLPAILEARENGATITSMTELTLEVGGDRLTAITGSNGKTSTTALTEAILKRKYGDRLIVGGNDRKPVLEEAETRVDEPILMEVSSFQFADLKVSPHIAAVLNIKPNHMDWHENLDDYVNAKANLIAHQGENDWAILNANDENSSKLAQRATARIFWVGSKRGQNWAIWEEGRLVTSFGGHQMEIMTKDHLRIKTHPDNILFAVGVAMIHAMEPEDIRAAVESFGGVPQRLEFLREVEGVKLYNDSACTTPESAEVAIGQFPKGQLILLLGGSSKESDFRFLAQHIVENHVRVVLYGEEGHRIAEAIGAEADEAGKEADDFVLDNLTEKDFEKIVRTAFGHAKKGDHVVLSPACASFDMFKNSKERGQIFSRIVEGL